MTGAKQLPQEYLALIKRFPLMPIENADQLQYGNELAAELAARSDSLSASERAYFLVLADLIESCERRLYPPKRLSPRDFLVALIQENALTISDLEYAGIAPRSNLSAFIHGRRRLSTRTIRRLADYFKVSADRFAEQIQ